MKPKNILVVTLGTTWSIIPELLGFTNPGLVDLYRNRADWADLRRKREERKIRGVDEVWVLTTHSEPTKKAIESLEAWGETIPEAPVLRIWVAGGATDLATVSECRAMADLIFRAVLNGKAQGGQLLLSLAGGRKTMSADMQWAASVLGCDAMLHVVDSFAGGPPDPRLKEQATFQAPLPPELAGKITPLVLASYDPNPIVEVSFGNKPPIQPKQFPLLTTECWPELFKNEPLLLEEIEKRLERAQNLLYNYISTLRQSPKQTNFLGLYHLPPRLIERLEETRFGLDPKREAEEIQFLRHVPKAELHCHLGGVGDAGGVLSLAEANRPLVEDFRETLNPWLRQWVSFIENRDAAGLWGRWNSIYEGNRPFRGTNLLVRGVPNCLTLSAFLLLFSGQPDFLDQFIFGSLLAPDQFVGVGFERYEALGDLQGSALLQTEAALRKACQLALEMARRDKVRYLELRCSPAKYTRMGLSPDQVFQVIQSEMNKGVEKGKLEVGLVLICSRGAGGEEAKAHIDLAQRVLEGRRETETALVGLDLAGDEAYCPPSQMRELFGPVMRKCLHMTIHAGELCGADAIWGAVYDLQAERVGHGLSLKDRPDLLGYFADRRIGIEMCPSSNLQIKGFRDSYLPSTAEKPEYPLRAYLERGLRVSVNTDNPGLSRTFPSKELHRAARLSQGGLSVWDLLLLVRNAFRASFAPRETRHRMLRQADEEIVQLVERGEW